MRDACRCGGVGAFVAADFAAAGAAVPADDGDRHGVEFIQHQNGASVVDSHAPAVALLPEFFLMTFAVA